MREDIFVHEPFLKELENIGWNDKSNGCEVKKPRLTRHSVVKINSKI